MSRLSAVGSWFFTCLGITLLAVSILVVPADVFADAGSDCWTGCNNQTVYPYDTCVAKCCATRCGPDTTCYNNCVAGGCQLQYSTNPTGWDGCCENACGSDQDCLANCADIKKLCITRNPKTDCSLADQIKCSGPGKYCCPDNIFCLCTCF